jgi:hypothetical protein
MASSIAFARVSRLSGLTLSALLYVPLSDLCIATVLVFMTLDIARLVCVKILLFYFTDHRAWLEGDLRQDHWPLCLFKGGKPSHLVSPLSAFQLA